MSFFEPNLHDMMDQLIENASDDIKNQAAMTLGHLVLANAETYLPFIIESLKLRKQEYYYIVAMNEMVSQLIHHGRIQLFEELSLQLWNLLFDAVVSVTEEGARSLISDCLGKILLSNPKQFLPLLQGRYTSPDDSIRSTVVTTFRYTLAHTDIDYDVMIAPVILFFLRLIEDPSLQVRKMALTALSSAIHLKYHLLTHIISEVMPMMYNQTIFREDLVVIVQMGPFQHKLDNGLDNRKIAYDCMLALIEHYDQLDSVQFIAHITKGLKDPAIEIKTSCHLIFQKLTKRSYRIHIDLDNLVEPLKESVYVKTKETAVKQEVENNRALVLSALKTVRALNANCASTDEKWKVFVSELRDAKPPISQLFQDLYV